MWNISHLQLHQQYAVDIGLVGKTNEAFESHVLVYLDYPMVLFGSQGEHFWPMFIGDQTNRSPPGSPDEPSQLHTSWTATFSHPEWCQLHRSIGCITQLNDIYADKDLNCFGYRPKIYLKLTLVEKYCCQVSKNPRTVAEGVTDQAKNILQQCQAAGRSRYSANTKRLGPFLRSDAMRCVDVKTITESQQTNT